MSLHATKNSLMVNVKEEVFVEEHDVSVVELISAEKESNKMLKQAVSFVYLVKIFRSNAARDSGASRQRYI